MNKILIRFLVLAIILIGIFFAFNQFIYNEKQGSVADSPKDASYVIEREVVKLDDGVSETDIPDSSVKVVTKYFGNELLIDLNNDGREDSVFILTQETGGSGTFFYVVGALNTEDGYVGSSAVFLGDRIAPQTINKDSKERPGVFVVNYVDRNEGESFDVRPSLGKSIWLKLDEGSMQFGEVVFDFEGEADPSRMNLEMKTWEWIQTNLNDGSKIIPKTTGAFTISFSDDGSFSVTTDCNNMGGHYVLDGSEITFGEIFSTKKYCEGSEEVVFAKILQDTVEYNFTGKGELIFQLKFDSGQAVFK